MKQDIQRDTLVLNRRELIKAFGHSAAAIMLPAAGLFSGPAHAQVTSRWRHLGAHAVAQTR